MRIGIEIDERIYNRIKNGEISDLIAMFVCGCVANGKPMEDDWIPISMMEPDTTDHVLVTYKWSDVCANYEVGEIDYWVTKYEAEQGNTHCKRLIEHITAWMPMPKPYTEGNNNE